MQSGKAGDARLLRYALRGSGPHKRQLRRRTGMPPRIIVLSFAKPFNRQ